jgi:Flp pilus assembly protein TadB
MSRLRWTLVALLVASTALFAVGVSLERSDEDTHDEPATELTRASAGEHAEGAGEEGERRRAEPAGHSESGESDTVLGVDVESTQLVVLAVLAGLALAALVASRFGRLRGALLAVAAIALAWAVLDVREVVHQVDESNTGIAIVAALVTVLHVAAAATAARLSGPQQGSGTIRDVPG